jgi:hypothetical protein
VKGSRPGYRDMEWFISAIEDGHLVAVAGPNDALVRLLRESPARAREPGSPMRATCQPREIEWC